MLLAKGKPQQITTVSEEEILAENSPSSQTLVGANCWRSRSFFFFFFNQIAIFHSGYMKYTQRWDDNNPQFYHSDSLRGFGNARQVSPHLAIWSKWAKTQPRTTQVASRTHMTRTPAWLEYAHEEDLWRNPHHDKVSGFARLLICCYYIMNQAAMSNIHSNSFYFHITTK